MTRRLKRRFSWVAIVGSILLISVGVLFTRHILPQANAAKGKTISPERLKDFGTPLGIICSSDGKIVYLMDKSGDVFRSEDYGNPGTWEQIVD